MSVTSDFWKAMNQSGVQISGSKSSSKNTSSGSTATGIAPIATPVSTNKKKKKNITEDFWDSLQGAELDIAPVGSKRGSSVADRVQARASGGAFNRKDKDEEDKWIRKGLFDDGYNIGDITKTILGTAGDVAIGAVKGFTSGVEGIVDLGSYGVAGVLDAVGKDDDADRLRRTTAKSQTDQLWGGLEATADKYSILGEKADAVIDPITNALGYIGMMYATAGIGAAAGATGAGATALSTGTMFASSTGGAMGEAYQGGASDEEALKHGVMKGAVDAGSELIFGGLGKGAKALGLSRGLSSLDDIFAKKLSSKISNHFWKNAVQYGVKASAEGVEEVLAGLGSAVSKKLTYMSDKELSELIKDENLMEQFAVGMASSAIMQSGYVPGTAEGSLREANKTGKDFITGQTQNEQAVIQKELENRIAEAEKDGTKLTNKQKADIEAEVVEAMEKGYISVDTIVEALGGEKYDQYKQAADRESSLQTEYDTLSKEYEDLGQKENPTLKDQSRYSELKEMLPDMKKRLDNVLATSTVGQQKAQLTHDIYQMSKSDRLVESFFENVRTKQKFDADLSKYDEKQKTVVQKAIDSGILNNSRRTHEFVDFIAKVSADKGVLFDFTNNAKLKESGFAVDGKQVNGFVTKDGITLNIDSAKAMNTTVGHEITHVLEGTEFYDSMKQTIFDYAKAKGEYQSRYDSLAEVYKDVKDADIEGELTADLVGDYIFSDPDFVKNLSTQNRNIFQKVYDEIKYLCKVVTAGSREARELERVKKAFEKAYREGGKTQTDTKYSVSETTDGRFTAVVESDILSNIDTTSWDKETKDAAKKAASEALKQFSDGIVVDGITRKVNKISRREYTRSKYTEWLYDHSPDVFADKMRAADVADDIVVATTNWQRDGGLKHPRTDDFVDFDHGNTLIASGNAKYSAEVVVGITSAGEAVLYDVVDMKPATFDIKKEESPATATTQNAIGDIKGDSLDSSVAQESENVNSSLSNSAPINEVTENGLTMTYVRVPNQNTQNYGSTYGQNIEPAGEYMSMDTMQGKYKIDGYEYGTIQFKKPLVLEHINTGATGWKKTVSDMYGGLTGKKLTKALIKDGYDAIVTYDDYGYSEIVNLNGQKFSLSNADEQHTSESLSALRLETAEESSFDAPTVSKTESVPVEAPIYESNDKNAPEGQTAMFDPVEEKRTTRKEYHQSIIDNIKDRFDEEGFDFDNVLKNAKNLSTWSTVDNTPQRVMEKALGYKEGGILSDITVNKVAQNETEGIKWLNSYVDQLKQISKQYHIKPGSKESSAAQMFAEGFYVNENNEIVRYGEPELIQDFKDPKVRANIKGLARDPRIRKIYDDTLGNINESRARNLYPEIPRLDNYFLHFRAMEDTFSTLGLPFNPNDIRAKDLPTDLNGVTADLKPGQPYFASANHRTGKRTSFDLLGGVERYLNSAKNQIYHIDDIQTLRALRNYIAETYGQATGLEDIDYMTDAEAEERIKQVYDSHLSTFAKFLNEEANVLAGKTALIDRGIEGIIGRRGITFLNTLNRQVGSNMVGYNVSSSLTNFLPVAQTFAKTNKFDFTKAFAQTVLNKLSGGRLDSFAKDSPVVIRRKGEDRFYRTAWQKMADPGYALMGMVDDISTEIIARTKYNEFTRKGMDSQKAHFETDKWVSKLMGDRSLGQQPQLYNSKMLGLVTKFQLEVRNQLDSQFYDTIQETKASNEHIQNGLARNAKTAAKVASVFTQLAVAQHLYGKAFESIAGYNPAFDIIEVLMTAFGYDDEEDSEDTVKDNLGQGFEAFMEDLPYASIVTGGGRIPISSALPIKEFFKGEDQYGNEKNRWETLGEVAPYYLMPGGYGQAKKTYQGLKMFSDDHPIAGSYTDAGNLRFNVEDTVGNRIKAGVFGQYASENARKYFDQEQRTLNPEQTEIFAGLDIPIEEYWEYRDNLYEFYDVKDRLKDAAYADEATDEDVLRYTYINNAYGSIYDLYDKQKELASGDSPNKKTEMREIQDQMAQMLSDSKYAVDRLKLSGAYGEVGDKRYNKDVDSGRWYEIKPKNADGSDNWYYQKEQEVTKGLGISYEEYWNNREEYNYAYDKPGRYAIAQTVGGYDSYMEYYDVLENWQSDNYLSADKDEKGNSISGSRKKKVQEYINGLDLGYGEKIILYRTVYSSKADKRAYNQDIIDYLNERDDISYQEMKTILEELDFKVDSEGYITW